MHLNNVNPMFFSTGEVIQGSQQVMGSFNKNSVVGNVGGQTMAIPPRQKQSSSGQGSMINFKQDMDENVYNAQQNQYWVQIDSSNGKQQSVLKASNSSTGQQAGPVQVKQSMIQMRKINPISKTAANHSHNTSFE